MFLKEFGWKVADLLKNDLNYLELEIHGLLGFKWTNVYRGVRLGCNRHSDFEIWKDFNNGHFVTYPVD